MNVVILIFGGDQESCQHILLSVDSPVIYFVFQLCVIANKVKRNREISL